MARFSIGSSSHPSREPLAKYSSIFASTSGRRSEGDRSSITKSGQISVNVYLFDSKVAIVAAQPEKLIVRQTDSAHAQSQPPCGLLLYRQWLSHGCLLPDLKQPDTVGRSQFQYNPQPFPHVLKALTVRRFGAKLNQR